MKKQKVNSTIDHVVKKTTIGRGRISTSTMNKHKRRSFKKKQGSRMKKKKFPDMSGDGKITKKDILMARGVIKKKTKKKVKKKK
jgi:hypothetical protein